MHTCTHADGLFGPVVRFDPGTSATMCAPYTPLFDPEAAVVLGSQSTVSSVKMSSSAMTITLAKLTKLVRHHIHTV